VLDKDIHFILVDCQYFSTIVFIHDFRLPLRFKLDLRSSGMLRSVYR